MKQTVLNMRLSQVTGGHPPAVRVRVPGLALRRSIVQGEANHWRVKGRRQVATEGVTPALPAPAAPDALPSADLSPCEVWWRLEDLWLRLIRHTTVRLEEDGGEYRLVVCGTGHESGTDLGALRAHAGDAGNYAWHLGNQRGSFAQLIDRQGDDLVCMLVPLSRIESWPEGPDARAMVQGFLADLRLEQAQAEPRRDAA